jgi:hypothetical protein
MAVIANSYILREIDTTDTEHFMWSANLLTSTVEHGLWDGHGVFSWAAVLADYSDRPWYASVRLYSVYNRVAKSLGVQVRATSHISLVAPPRTYRRSSHTSLSPRLRSTQRIECTRGTGCSCALFASGWRPLVGTHARQAGWHRGSCEATLTELGSGGVSAAGGAAHVPDVRACGP